MKKPKSKLKNLTDKIIAFLKLLLSKPNKPLIRTIKRNEEIIITFPPKSVGKAKTFPTKNVKKGDKNAGRKNIKKSTKNKKSQIQNKKGIRRVQGRQVKIRK